MLMVAMGMIFPPVGLLAFVVSATARVDIVTVYRGTTVLLLPIIATMILVMIFPEIALWLPSSMRR
jgi:TRAP-type C4-dicarboxylate transport system permease large subunit